MKTKPTAETYGELQQAYDHFNQVLFDGRLPEALITLQREKATYGYFSHSRFANSIGEKIDEIALNPTYFGVVPLVEIMSTLVHEMSHQFQAHFGKPGRGRYHNAEWANMMENIGLMPSSTGKPGGLRTGDQMADYPIEGGRFLQACESLLTQEFKISWYDRFPSYQVFTAGQQSFTNNLDLDLPNGFTVTPVRLTNKPELVTQTGFGGVEAVRNAESDLVVPSPTKPNKSNRIKYVCECERPNAVWGRAGLSIICSDCGSAFAAQDQ